MNHRVTATACLLALALVAPAWAVVYVDEFTDGANPTGWAWNGFAGVVETTGGNPGGYVHDNEFFSMPVVRSEIGVASPFHGDYRAAGVSEISFDTRTFSNQAGGSYGQLGALVLNNTSTGMFAWTLVGDLTDPRAGWIHTTVAIPSQSMTLPGGWVGDSFGDPFNWNSLITNVDQVELRFFNPDWFGIGAAFDVGMDNAAITYVPEPAGALLLALGALGLRRRR